MGDSVINSITAPVVVKYVVNSVTVFGVNPMVDAIRQVEPITHVKLTAHVRVITQVRVITRMVVSKFFLFSLWSQQSH